MWRAVVLAASLLLVACGADPGLPSTPPAGSPSATPASTPAATPTLDTSIFGPLPEVLAGLPLGGGPSAEIEPETTRGLPIDPATGHAYELGHCGLLGPFDFDGSLWVAQGAHNGTGGPLSQDQLGELLNATTVRVFLLDDDHALLVTPLNGFVLLARHEGAREYALCD